MLLSAFMTLPEPVTVTLLGLRGLFIRFQECTPFLNHQKPHPMLRVVDDDRIAQPAPWLGQVTHSSPEDPDTEMTEQEEGQSHLHGPSTPRPVTGSPSGRDTKSRSGTAIDSEFKANPKRITESFEKKFQNLYLDSVLLMPKFRNLQFDTVCCPHP